MSAPASSPTKSRIFLIHTFKSVQTPSIPRTSVRLYAKAIEIPRCRSFMKNSSASRTPTVLTSCFIPPTPQESLLEIDFPKGEGVRLRGNTGSFFISRKPPRRLRAPLGSLCKPRTPPIAGEPWLLCAGFAPRFCPLPFRGGAAAAAEGVMIYRLPCRTALLCAEKPVSRQDSRAK